MQVTYLQIDVKDGQMYSVGYHHGKLAHTYRAENAFLIKSTRCIVHLLSPECMCLGRNSLGPWHLALILVFACTVDDQEMQYGNISLRSRFKSIATKLTLYTLSCTNSLNSAFV